MNKRGNRINKTVTTRSGRSIKVNQSLGQRWSARKEAKALRKAERMRGLPKSRVKRMLWRLDPKRQAEFWFSRDGAIMGLKITGIAILFLFLFTLAIFAYFRKDLPHITDISGDNLGGSISYYDRTGQTLLWQDYNDVKRVPVASDAISPYIKKATVAIEDHNFYQEKGFDIKGIARAAIVDATHGGARQGGSTITQQLVKLTQDFNQNRTVGVKIKELILAVELERTYTKDQILTGYLNAAPYGGVDYGVQTAASDYFHESAKDLTLAQSAFLAAIPQSPAYYSPYDSVNFDKQALLDRKNYVLDQMVTYGMVTRAQANAAKQVDVLAQVHPIQTHYAGIQAPYFVLSAKNQLDTQFVGETTKVGGWKVITTLDMGLQKKAEHLVATNLPHVQGLTGGAADEEATVLENVPTGQIEALVGGTDFTNKDHGEDNYASGILIPPGSSFKPYDYVTLINNNNNVGAGSVLYDTKGAIPGYPNTCNHNPNLRGAPPCPPGTSPAAYDYDNIFPGPLTLRYALGGSRNVPAMKAMLEAVPNDKSTGHVDSINKVISTASAMMDNTYLQSQNKKTYNCYADEQLTKTTQCYTAAAIGDGAFLHLDDHVNGDATLGRLGNAIPKTYILKITDAANKTVYQWKQPKGTQVVKQDAAYIVNNMLSDPNASYLPGSCSATNCTSLAQGGYKFQHDNGWNFAVKTGTTNNGFDGLMTSWSSQFAVVSWVGNHNRNKDLSAYAGAAMETLTEPLTRGMMEAAHAGMKPQNWEQPKDIKTLPAFVVRKHIHYGDIEPSPTNDLYPSWYVGKSGGSNSSQTLDKVSGKVATSCTPASAKQNAFNSNAASWNIDIFNGGTQSVGGHSVSGTTSTATDDVHKCSDSPPTINLTATDNDDGTATLAAFVSAGTHPFNDSNYSQFPGTVTFYVNGKSVGSKHVNDPQDNVSIKYTIPNNGNYDVSATVTDSVLYSATDSETIRLKAAAKGLSFESIGATSASWSGGDGTYTLTNTDNNTQLCQTINVTNCTYDNGVTLSPGTHVRLQDGSGHTKDGTSQ
ncbi:MAG TPA: transglycosylase domain-containing protein [Candidatus Saccharimonadales bacterium]|nr:transglycosylase domain-containing protein [Candidatus Saccharimonadales bacterium]